jgi:hypothetical protein
VGAGARVLRLERARKRRDRLLVGLLEEDSLPPLDLEEMPEVARVEEELLLGPLLLRRPERDAVQAARKTLDDRQQLEWAERLADERIGACLSGLGLRPALGPGEEHDRDPARLDGRLELAAVLEPGHAGHRDVENDHVGLAPVDPGPGGPHVGGLFHVDVPYLEGRAEKCAEPRIVVDKQKAHL